MNSANIIGGLTAFVLLPCAVRTAAALAREAEPVGTTASIVKSEFVFERAPFAECHASTICQTSKGRLVAAWFGGTREGARDVCIWLSRLDKDTWTEPTKVADGVQPDAAQLPSWNPVLFQPKAGPLLLFYKVGPNPRTWWGMLKTSGDDGATWSAAQRLPEGILGPIKNKPVQLSSGAILCPSSTEDNGWRVHFEWTTDLGKTWDKTQPVNDGDPFGAIQPSILVHPGGKLQAIGRTRQKRIFEIWSDDQGRTWSAMTATSLPNPNSGIDAVTLRDGGHILVYNDCTTGRSPLNVAISNSGKDWDKVVDLETARGEYSYPAVIQTDDDLVHVTYTWKRTRIKHVVLDPRKLRAP